MRLVVFLLVLLIPAASYAQDAQSLCQVLTNHKPADDVNYVAGKEDVVPADVGGGIKQPVFDPISVPIQVDLIERLDLGVIETDDGVILEPYVAQVDVYQDGRVLYNGQDITEQTMVLCEDADGQEQGDAVNSQSEETIEIKKGIEGQPLPEHTDKDE